MTARASLKSVADALGVSVMTVSNALNDKPGVSEKTRKRVQKEAARQGYVPTSAARSLRSSRNYAAGFVMIDPGEDYIADYLTGQIVAGLSRRLNDKGYNLLIRLCRPEELEHTTLFRRRSIDGLAALLSGTPDQRAAISRVLANLEVPTVTVQTTPDQCLRDAACVRQDDFEGARLLADHLAARGAQRVLAVVTEARWPAFEARLEGLRAGLAALPNGGDLQVLRLSSERTATAVREVGEHLDRNQRPDAVAGGNDVLAIAAVSALRERGLRVPEDVMVTGFNDLDFANLFSPRLTTVHSRGRDIGEATANALLERMEAGAFPQRETVLPISLMLGGSTMRGEAVSPKE